MRSIDAVIFDWGGVLIEDPAPLLRSVLSRTLGVPPDQFAQALDRHAEPFQKGRCTELEFWQRLCRDLGSAPPAVPWLWGAAFRAVYRPRPRLWSLLGLIRQQGCKTALLSNTEMPAVEYFHALQPTAFDVLVFSCCEGCRKPEMRIYELAIERLSCPAGRALFVDDHPRYVQAAEALGLQAVLFAGLRTLQRQLRAAGLVV